MGRGTSLVNGSARKLGRRGTNGSAGRTGSGETSGSAWVVGADAVTERS